MNIEKKNVKELLPADYNPRKDLKPGDPEYEKLKRSIEQFGYVEPVIWNKATGRVVGGHQRLKVLIDMGISEVECVVVELDEEKEKALNIALNKISGDWDKDKLALLIADLQGADFDVSPRCLRHDYRKFLPGDRRCCSDPDGERLQRPHSSLLRDWKGHIQPEQKRPVLTDFRRGTAAYLGCQRARRNSERLYRPQTDAHRVCQTAGVPGSVV